MAATDAQKRASKNYYEKIKSDPEKYKMYLERQRGYYPAFKNSGYQEHKVKRREYYHQNVEKTNL